MSENILEKQLFEIIKNKEMAENIKLAKIDMLIRLGVNVNARDDNGDIALGMTDNITILEKLIEAGANIHQVNIWDMAPLELALKNGCFEGAEYLISKGADVNRRGVVERTPLMKVETKEAAEFLLEHGADLFAVDKYERGVIYEAFCGGHLDIVEYFMEKGADTSKMPELFSWCNDVCTDRAEFLIKKGLKPSDADLRHVIRHDYPELALLYIEYGENLDFTKTNDKGDNILAEALRELKDESVAIALIDKGCKLISRDNEDSILLEAAYQGRLEVVKKMLEKGEDINQVNKYHQTPLYLATLNRKIDVVEHLLKSGADYNIARDRGDTPIMCSIKHQDADVLEILLDNIDKMPDKFREALHLSRDGSDERKLLKDFMKKMATKTLDPLEKYRLTQMHEMY